MTVTDAEPPAHVDGDRDGERGGLGHPGEPHGHGEDVHGDSNDDEGVTLGFEVSRLKG